ncbi:hypothetical protein [Phytohabitans rumicis]|uniref:Uncharacterized protein n=1 Tax=Phytohabitans rumicis TaxID=1076125 RepID=A0A6V8KXX9_9ACTN|nr:hypothetical protein [Phytohabitans rumicis]GFJ88684.1 hypothetical protein Prum_023260 [Phytohabitans rumicis]
MTQNDDSDVICLPRLEDLSPRQLLALDRPVLADVIRDEIEKSAADDKMARFSNYLSL